MCNQKRDLAQRDSKIVALHQSRRLPVVLIKNDICVNTKKEKQNQLQLR